jgi:murein DD-endopeptidase MepM/ murein hydrolase activator NlpD
MAKSWLSLVVLACLGPGATALADELPASRPGEDAPGSCRGIALTSPLDAPPRLVLSDYGTPRPHGRRHRGLDFVSVYGEPVRSAADGVVVFAGIGHRRGRSTNLTPEKAKRVRRRAMGIGGLFVMIEHGNGLVSGYFHLAGYTVGKGDRVQRGQIIGSVGDTGMKESVPHLHFELRVNKRNINPTRFLGPSIARPRPRLAALAR